MTRRRAKRDTRWKIIKLVFLFCVFVGVLTLIWIRTTVKNIEYELSQIENEKVELTSELKLLTAKKAKSYSMEKIEKDAVNQLGMSLPERENIFYVKKTTGAAPYRVSIKSVPRDN